MLEHAERALMFFGKSGDSDYAKAGFDAGLYDLINRAADLHLSQLYTHEEKLLGGWDDEKKEKTEGCFFMGRMIRLLIIEAEHEDWLNDDFEEILRKSLKEVEENRKKKPPQPPQGPQGPKKKTVYVHGTLVDPKTFINRETNLPVKH
jgi:hypothetical protein